MSHRENASEIVDTLILFYARPRTDRVISFWGVESFMARFSFAVSLNAGHG
jgi:hypothetical protein